MFEWFKIPLFLFSDSLMFVWSDNSLSYGSSSVNKRNINEGCGKKQYHIFPISMQYACILAVRVYLSVHLLKWWEHLFIQIIHVLTILTQKIIHFPRIIRKILVGIIFTCWTCSATLAYIVWSADAILFWINNLHPWKNLCTQFGSNNLHTRSWKKIIICASIIRSIRVCHLPWVENPM